MSKSLQATFSRHLEVAVLWLASAITLGFGLCLPVLTFKELVFKTKTFSIYSGIINLAQSNHYYLAAIIFVFSIVFPILKLTGLFIIWFFPISKNKRSFFLEALSSLGKWSMLDVFVVAVMIVVAKGSGLAKAEPMMGIYVFSVSVLLSIITSLRIKQLAKKSTTP